MKRYKKILWSLMVPALTMGMASCSDKDDYVVGSLGSGPGVYFASNMKSAYNASQDGTPIQIPVYRLKKDGAITVGIEVESTADDASISQFKFDENVTFADGENMTYLTITYDPMLLEFDDTESFTLYIDPEYATNYGVSEKTISLVLPAPWISLGEGRYVDDYFFEGEAQFLTFYQSEVNPNRYRVPNPYFTEEEIEQYDLPPYFEFEVLMEGDQYEMDFFGQVFNIPVDLDDSVGYQPFYFISDEADDGTPIDFYFLLPTIYQGTDWTHNRVVGYQEDKEPSQGVTLPGEIKLSPLVMDPVTTYWFPNLENVEFITMIFPGYTAKNTNLEVSYVGTLSSYDELYVVGDLTMGADLSSVKVAVAPGSDASSIISAVDGGSLPSTNVLKSGEFRIPFEANSDNGNYTLVALGYVDDKLENTAYVNFSYYGSSYDPNEGWTSLGYVDYTDGYICVFFTTGLNTYQVEIQENDEYPGVYRLVDPYNQDVFPYILQGCTYLPGYYYLYVDAQDPDHVYIPLCDQSLVGPASLSGQLACYSFAGDYLAYGYPVDEVDDAAVEDGIIEEGGTVWGKLENGKITFPFETLIVFFGNDGFFANWAVTQTGEQLTQNGEYVAPFCIDLNSIVAEPVAARASYASRASDSFKVINAGKGKPAQHPKRLSSKLQKGKATKGAPKVLAH